MDIFLSPVLLYCDVSMIVESNEERKGEDGRNVENKFLNNHFYIA